MSFLQNNRSLKALAAVPAFLFFCCSTLVLLAFTPEKENWLQTPKAADSAITDLSKIRWNDVTKMAAKDGELVATYTNGDKILLSRKAYAVYARQNEKVSTDFDKVFTRMEIEPQYPGGEKAWLSYLKKNMHVNSAGRKVNREVVVNIQFNVDVEGNISDVKSISGFIDGVTNEAIRLVQESGKWHPGIQNFRLVNALITRRITIGPDTEVLI